MKQYPHFLYIIQPGESMQDEDGNWTETDNETVYIGPCREETSGKGNELRTAGGRFITYTSVIQLPKGSTRIQEGTTIIVSDDANCNSVRIKGTCLKYDAGQLHSRLWV